MCWCTVGKKEKKSRKIEKNKKKKTTKEREKKKQWKNVRNTFDSYPNYNIEKVKKNIDEKHSPWTKKACRNPGLNQGPLDLQSNALPTELFRRVHEEKREFVRHISDYYDQYQLSTWSRLPQKRRWGLTQCIFTYHVRVIYVATVATSSLS